MANWCPYLLLNLAISQNFIKCTKSQRNSPYHAKCHWSLQILSISHWITPNLSTAHWFSAYLTQTKFPSRTSCGTLLWGDGGQLDFLLFPSHPNVCLPDFVYTIFHSFSSMTQIVRYCNHPGDGPLDRAHVFQQHRLIIPTGEPHSFLWRTMFLIEWARSFDI